MADLIELTITHYDHHGVPLPGELQLVNLDLVANMAKHLGNNIASNRHSVPAPEAHYPCLELTMQDGSKYLASLGTFSTVEDGMAALDAFTFAITATLSELTDADRALLRGECA